MTDSVHVAVLKTYGGSCGGGAALVAVRAARDTRGLLHIHSALEEGGQRMLQAAATSQRVKEPPRCWYQSQLRLLAAAGAGANWT